MAEGADPGMRIRTRGGECRGAPNLDTTGVASGRGVGKSSVHDRRGVLRRREPRDCEIHDLGRGYKFERGRFTVQIVSGK
jgi:hypothetical protein